jgi:hypothetical protein
MTKQTGNVIQQSSNNKSKFPEQKPLKLSDFQILKEAILIDKTWRVLSPAM